jgi:FkbM family methyltransferase
VGRPCLADGKGGPIVGVSGKTRVLKRYTKHETFSDAVMRNITIRFLSKKTTEHGVEQGQRMAVYANDPLGRAVYVNGIYEKDLLDALKDFLSPLDKQYLNWDVLDVGANIGNHSVYFSKMFKRVLAFEPNPSVFALLAFNASYADNIEAHNYGLGAAKGTLELFEDPLNISASSTVHKNEALPPVEIDIRQLDELNLPFDDLGLMKIDVEGMEASVLKGGQKTIGRWKPIVLFEQLSSEFSGQSSETESIKILRSLGYKFCWLQHSVSKRPWILRRLKNLYELVFGRLSRSEVVTSDVVPAKTYSMIMAIPPRHQKLLGL